MTFAFFVNTVGDNLGLNFTKHFLLKCPQGQTSRCKRITVSGDETVFQVGPILECPAKESCEPKVNFGSTSSFAQRNHSKCCGVTLYQGYDKNLRHHLATIRTTRSVCDVPRFVVKTFPSFVIFITHNNVKMQSKATDEIGEG